MFWRNILPLSSGYNQTKRDSAITTWTGKAFSPWAGHGSLMLTRDEVQWFCQRTIIDLIFSPHGTAQGSCDTCIASLRRDPFYTYFCSSEKGPVSLLVQLSWTKPFKLFLPHPLAHGPPSAIVPSVTVSPLLIVPSCPRSGYSYDFYITIHLLTLTHFHPADRGSMFLCHVGVDLRSRS